jgi:hypothetical protein
MEDIINIVDDLGNVAPGQVGTISFLRPAYDPIKKTHVYKRAINLSNSDQVSYNDLTMGGYIHYIPSPGGGQGLLDVSSSAFRTDITISRNLVLATYSPYN